MTPEQHNKYLALAHIAYGGVFLLMMIAMMTFFGFMITVMESQGPPNDAPPPFVWIFVFGFMAVFYGIMVLPSFVAGYSLLKRKSWARIASIVAGVMAGMSFPLGTAVCIYTFWFLFSEPGKLLYERPSNVLPPPAPAWAKPLEINRQAPQYQPPDWR